MQKNKKEDFTLRYSSDQEEGEIIGLKGKEKAYDLDGVFISTDGNNKNENKTVMKSQKVHICS